MGEPAMNETVNIRINGQPVRVTVGTSVAAAVLNIAQPATRQSVTGERRAPLCGMGICFECRLTIDGRPHQKSCMMIVREGMEVRDDQA